MPEYFDLLDEHGNKTGNTKDRKLVHKDGDWHRAVHVWLYCLESQELLIQKRASCKDSWAGLWDISAAGHVEAGQESRPTAQREFKEELGIDLPLEAFEPLYTMKQQSTANNGAFVNNEFDDVYLVSVKGSIPLELYTLQDDEVEQVKYVHRSELERSYREADPTLVPDTGFDEQSGKLFKLLEQRAKSGSLPGSGIGTLVLTFQGGGKHEIQYVIFDEDYLKLVPPEHR